MYSGYEYEDIKREYFNRYSEKNGKVFSDDYDGFVQTVLKAIQKTMNESHEGQTFMDEQLAMAISQGMTPEQWQAKRVEIMKVLFFLTLEEFPVLKHEFALHLYDELRKE